MCGAIVFNTVRGGCLENVARVVVGADIIVTLKILLNKFMEMQAYEISLTTSCSSWILWAEGLFLCCAVLFCSMFIFHFIVIR